MPHFRHWRAQGYINVRGIVKINAGDDFEGLAMISSDDAKTVIAFWIAFVSIVIIISLIIWLVS